MTNPNVPGVPGIPQPPQAAPASQVPPVQQVPQYAPQSVQPQPSPATPAPQPAAPQPAAPRQQPAASFNSQQAAQSAQAYARQAATSVDGFAQKMATQHVEIAGRKFDMVTVITYAGVVLTFLAMFLPLVQASGSVAGIGGASTSVSLFQAPVLPWLVIIMLAMVVLFTVFRKYLGGLIVGIIMTLLFLWWLISGTQASRSVSAFGGFVSGDVSMGFGSWLLFIGSAAMAAGSLFAILNRRRAAKSGTTGATNAAAVSAPVAAQSYPQATAPTAAYAAPAAAPTAASTVPAAPQQPSAPSLPPMPQPPARQ